MTYYPLMPSQYLKHYAYFMAHHYFVYTYGWEPQFTYFFLNNLPRKEATIFENPWKIRRHPWVLALPRRRKYQALCYRYWVYHFFKYKVQFPPVRPTPQASFLLPTLSRNSSLAFFFSFVTLHAQRSHTLNGTFWFLQFLSQYLQHFTLNKLVWAFTAIKLPSLVNLQNQFSGLINHKIYRQIDRLSRGRALEFVTLLLYTKNIRAYVRWFNRWMETIHFKQHKKCFTLIDEFTYLIIVRGMELRLVRGYTLFFRGKLARGGSVRKKYLFLRRGQFSGSSKKLQFFYQKFLIRTATGVVGGQLSIYYK